MAPQYDTPQPNPGDQDMAEHGPQADQGGALVKQPNGEQEGGALVSWDEKPAAFIASFDAFSPDGQALFWKALQKGDRLLSQVVNVELPVVNYFVHEAERIDEQTGEVKRGPRLVMILRDGSTVSTSSTVFMKGFRYAIGMHGKGPWEPPLMMKASLAQGKGPNKYLAFEGCRREDETVTTKPATEGGKKK